MTLGRRKWRYYHCHLEKRRRGSKYRWLKLWLEPSILTPKSRGLFNTPPKCCWASSKEREANPTWRIWSGFLEEVAFEMRCWLVSRESGGMNSQQEWNRWKACRVVRKLTRYGKERASEGLGKQDVLCCKELLRAGLRGLAVKRQSFPRTMYAWQPLITYKIEVEKKLNELGHQRD